MELMTDKEYVDRSGLVCPVCHSDEITTTDSDHDGSIIYVNIRCYGCNAEWTEQYKLSGYGEVYLEGSETPIQPQSE